MSNTEFRSSFPEIKENDHLIEFWIFGWDNSRLYVTMNHICIYWSVALHHEKIIPLSSIQDISLDKKTISITLATETITLSKFTSDIHLGVYIFLSEMWNPTLGKDEVLLKANSNLYVKRRISIPSKTSFCIQLPSGELDKAFPLKYLLGLEVTSKPWHVKIYEKTFEVEFFIRDVQEWIEKFQSMGLFVEYESKVYEQWFQVQTKVTEKKERAKSIRFETTRSKLDHPNLDRPRQKKNHSKKRLEIKQPKILEPLAWLCIVIQDNVECTWDLETLLDGKIYRYFLFKPWTHYVQIRESKAKAAIDYLANYVYDQYPIKISKWSGESNDLYLKFQRQYDVEIGANVEFREDQLVVEWIGEYKLRVFVGMDYKDGDSDGMFEGEMRFKPKTKALFVPMENFLFKPQALIVEKPKTGLKSLFAKKEVRIAKPLLLKKSWIPIEPRPEIIVSSDVKKKFIGKGKVPSTPKGKEPVIDITRNIKESNITDHANLARPRRKKNVRGGKKKGGTDEKDDVDDPDTDIAPDTPKMAPDTPKLGPVPPEHRPPPPPDDIETLDSIVESPVITKLQE